MWFVSLVSYFQNLLQPQLSSRKTLVFLTLHHMFISTALGGVFKSLWMVLGLRTKGPRILRDLLCSIKTFCPPFYPPTNKHHLIQLPTHIQAQTLHHPVSKTPPVRRGRFMGSGRVRQVPSSLGGCHSSICIPKSLSVPWKTSPLEPKDWRV